MSDQVITCPRCSFEIQLEEAISAPIVEQLRMKFDTETRRREEEFATRELELSNKTKQVEQLKIDIDEQVAARVKVERERISLEEAKKARDGIGLEIRELQEQLSEKDKKLSKAQKEELELRKQRRELEDQQRQLQLQVAREIDEERETIIETVKKELAEEYTLKNAEKEQQLAAMRTQINDLRRKAEQGSQQIQGEVLELELEAFLENRFPGDKIEPVPKGQYGGDVLQHVHDNTGTRCGAILWESKRTKAWSDRWLIKLRDDQRAAKAELAALVTTTMPKNVATFDRIDNIWVTNRACVVGLATALRMSLIEANSFKKAVEGKQSKMENLYTYLTGQHFKQRVEAICESFITMRDDLEQEKRAIQRIWAKREKQIERVLINTVGLHGDVAGIIGRSLPEIQALELPVLEVDSPSNVNAEQ
ncbi:MAG: DUF2130 domain-containing protein [Phycisphaerales bacterium]|nr:DUF2130 domain-containing protein [Phycisphaerales bacterium]